MSGDHFSFIGAIAGTLCCVSAFECNLYFDNYGGILLWILMMLYMFKALGTICDEYFVPSLEVIVEKLQLSNDVAGATFMAAGSSAPELFTSLVATFLIVNEGGVGTIIGSAIFNILVIVGATGVIACKDKSLKIWWYPLCRDCFFYSLAILEMMVVLSDERVMWYEGLIMFLTYICYCVYMKFNPAIIRMLGIIDLSESSDVQTVVAIEEKAEQKTVDSTSTPVESTNGTTQAEATTVIAQPTPLRSLAMENETEDTRQPEIGGRENVSTPGAVNTVNDDEVKEVRIAGGDVDGSADKQDCGKDACSLLEPAEKSERRRPSWGYSETKKNEVNRHGSEGVVDSPAKGPAPVKTEDDNPPPLVLAEDDDSPQQQKGWIRDPLVVFWELTMPPPDRMGGASLFSMSILFIGLATYVMVDATNRTGVILHIPPLAMALVFLAAGTSIPDALGSIAVAKQGEGDMAVANALGSNVFDILVGLGIPWFIKTGILQQKVEFIGKWDELIYDIFVLVFVLFFFILCMVVHKWHLTRRVGFLLIAMYFLFLLYNVFAIWVIDPPLKTQKSEAHCDTL